MPDSLLSDGWVAFLLGGAALLILAIGLRPRRRAPSAVASPRGVGAALAFALDGELARARALMEAQVRATRGADPDAVLGLLAVLRAEGRHARAAALVQGLLRRQSSPWLLAAGVRICLDAGQPLRAAALARSGPVPLDLRVAAFVRAGRPAEALAVLAGRTGRREGTPAQLASVLALVALELARQGDERGARRRFKRALAIAPDAIAVLVAGEHLHARPADRTRAAARLAERCSREAVNDASPSVAAGRGRGLRAGRTPADEASIEEGVLGMARAAVAEGKLEEALGRLRDRLDKAPDDDAVRRQYEAWIVAHGDPADWRAALAERAELGPPRAPEAASLACSHCGLAIAEPVFLCPRCDRFDTLQRASGEPPRAGVRPSALGARLVDIAPETAEPRAS